MSKALLDKMLTSGNATLGKTLDDYAAAQSVLQHVDNPSGTCASPLGLVGGGSGELMAYWVQSRRVDWESPSSTLT